MLSHTYPDYPVGEADPVHPVLFYLKSTCYNFSLMPIRARAETTCHPRCVYNLNL